jgi:magnesium transporter
MEQIKIQNLIWIDLVDPDKKDIKYLEKTFKFHPFVLKELLSPTLRPKVEDYDGYLFMILHFPIYSPDEKITRSMELDFLLTHDALITIRYDKIQPLQEFWKKCREGKDLPALRNSPALLLHCILQELNNFSLRQIDHITKKIDDVEKKIFKIKRTKEEKETVEKITLIRRDILDFRRTIKPQAAILKSLKTRGIEFFGKRMLPYFIDIMGDYSGVWDLLENHKETIESLQEANDSLLSNKTNMVMKILTVFAVIVFPLTLLAAIFGMNTKYLPLVGMEHDFWMILGIMIIGTAIMLVVFKAKKWL